MGLSTEQTVAVIEAVGEVIDFTQPDVINTTQPSEPNYWWLLSLAIIPVLLGYWLNRRGSDDRS